jgi:flagellar basal body-associated protein FliL
MATRATTPAPSREPEAEAPAEEGAESAEAAPKKSGGKLKPWLPMIITVVAMPGLAYLTTQYFLLPKIKHSMTQAAAGNAAEAASPAAHGTAPAPAAGASAKSGKEKVTYEMPKILVNVAGTMMTRYLMTTLTLVGDTPDFKEKMEANLAQLKDVARGTLETKTIGDLEKPGARNQMRSELLTVFNNALGGPMVKDLYITEQAVQ